MGIVDAVSKKNPDAIVNYLRAWLEVSRDFKEQPKKVAEVIYGFFTSKGYKMSLETFQTALGIGDHLYLEASVLEDEGQVPGLSRAVLDDQDAYHDGSSCGGRPPGLSILLGRPGGLPPRQLDSRCTSRAGIAARGRI